MLVASTATGAAAAGGGYLLGKSALSDPAVSMWIDRLRAGLVGWDLLAVPLLLLLVFGVHEIGHLVGGLSQRMRFLLLIVGPFQWHRSASGVKFQWVTRLGLMGGIAATMPTEVGSKLRRQLLFAIAGGPVASLLLIFLALLVVPSTDPRVAAYGAFVALASFGIFLVTAIPMRSGGFMSDGMQLLEVIRGSRSVIERARLLQVAAQSLAGVRPRDWEQESVDGLVHDESTEPLRQIAGWQLLLYRAMDTGNDRDLRHYQALLVQGVERFPDGFRQAIHVDLAICAGLRGDREAAHQHLSSSKGGVVEKSRRLLGQAVVAELEGRWEDSRLHAEAAARALPQAMDPGLAELTREQLGRLRGAGKWSG